MSKNYGKVKGYYDTGRWSEKMVRNAVGRWITEEEYETIAGQKY